MSVIETEFRRRTPFFDGAYERLDGVVRFAVAPDALDNAGITDLALAPRDPAGRARFEADFCVLRPVRGSSGRLLFTVPNRGRHGAVPFSVLSVPPTMEISERIDAGDGFLLRRGWTVAWCGWQWDVPRQPGLLGLTAPEARLPPDERGGQVLVQFQPHQRQANHGLDHWPLDPAPGQAGEGQGHRPYVPRDRLDPASVLTVRGWPGGPAAEVPRDRWWMEGTSVWLSGGFEPGRVYELRYTPRDCPVVGAGLLAVRDFVSWLRRTHGDLTHAFGFGVSQSGRFLREFLYQGLNRDEDGRAVFDGVLVHVAGARRGEFNQRYGQPSVQHAPSPGHLPPFADAHLLERQRERGAMPQVFSVNTSSEYWRSEASLCHADVELPPEARTYLFAGCQHGPGGIALTHSAPMSPWVRPANPLNTVDYTPLLRAAVVNLERWAVDGIEPPPSAVPSVADGTAAERGEVLRRFAGREEVALPRAEHLPALRRLDFSTFPPAAGEPYPCFVSSVDADGNEEAGIRLPDLTVPLGAHTGWNPRHPDSGGEGQLIDMLGSTLPLPQPSIADRYGSREAYCDRVRAAAERLVAARHLLPEDVEAVVARAGLRWDVTQSAGG